MPRIDSAKTKMPNAKIDFAFGSLTFSGEGEENWLAQQLDKILSAAPTLSELHAPTQNGEPQKLPGSGAGAPIIKTEVGPLAQHIHAKGGQGNQSKRFLATADWLRLRGETSLTTRAVTQALSDNRQSKLTNPAQCLNQNVSRGLCEKTSGGAFYITPEGLKDLGHQL
jgi:hypothetical protein